MATGGTTTTTNTGSTSSRTKFGSTKLSSTGKTAAEAQPPTAPAATAPASSPASAPATAPATSPATASASASASATAAAPAAASSYDPVPLYSNIDYNYYLDSKAQAHLLPLQQYILEQAKVGSSIPHSSLPSLPPSPIGWDPSTNDPENMMAVFDCSTVALRAGSVVLLQALERILEKNPSLKNSGRIAKIPKWKRSFQPTIPKMWWQCSTAQQ